MKKFFNLSILLLFFSAMTVYSQNNTEQEIRKIIIEYDRAVLNSDIGFIEKMFSDDYVASVPNGKTETKKQTIEATKNATFKVLSASTNNVQVRVSGNIAVVTADWTLQTVHKDNPSAQPHTDSGRLTTVLEKRNGKWLIIADHLTEKPHSAEEMEQLLRKASNDYDEAMGKRDAKAFEKLFADEYVYTGETGEMRDKKQEIAKSTDSNTKYETAQIDEKKFRIFGNTAVETGRYKVSGTSNGKPFTVFGRYTTTWVWRNGGWRIVADHNSPIK